ncbi:FAD/NAD(P)-binding domain-containing protein [Westerdykella ornata]|uniref:FAD/NAD(P)-binding domain-containing protein n=1 Tax=Westerdykella ornata TaxID=318751 RepID=A0A6A6JEU6_WESOR|nr:FAD/NAD(P)-binding domain-containing protein [Westerdykella ornata]KAF2275081.1 FAD/NAD(P)-binding domain-containing protein [Westerdykella ornata]
MTSSPSLLTTLLFLLALVGHGASTLSKALTRDVAIIGGGASGTYAAVRLSQDLNTSIVLIEAQDHLSGHVSTYIEPSTNTPIDYGVQSYINYGPAANFFARFGVETKPFAARRLTSVPVDIETGARLTGYTPPSLNATNAGFAAWLAFVARFETILDGPGYWDFPSPDRIPSDLLLPFGEFVARHPEIAPSIPRIAAISGIGAGGFKQLLTIDVVVAFGAPITRDVIAGGFIVPVVSNSLVYQRAYEVLKKDVLLRSRIKKAERRDKGVRLVVATPEGDVLVKAKRVLWTPYPSLDRNLVPFDVNQKEKDVFESWIVSPSFVGVLKVPCIPENYSIDYIAPAAVPADYLAVRDHRYTLRLDSTGPKGLGLFRALLSTNYSLTVEEAKQIIAGDIQKLVEQRTVEWSGSCDVEFKAFADHTGVMWPTQDKEELEKGFVQRLYALQGYRSTWWTGRSFSAYYSSSVWAFTEGLLERLLKDLKGE